MKDELLSIINHYGLEKQLKYFQTEIFELNQAILANIYDSEGTTDVGYIEHIAEEIADVNVMLAQFQYFFDIDIKDVASIMERKINRQLERIEKDEKEMVEK